MRPKHITTASEYTCTGKAVVNSSRVNKSRYKNLKFRPSRPKNNYSPNNRRHSLQDRNHKGKDRQDGVIFRPQSIFHRPDQDLTPSRVSKILSLPGV